MKNDPPSVLTVAEASALVRAAQADGLVVVMCHGCFDLVHPGHVRHLQQAARLGDRLLVTVTADSLLGKGPDRPLIPQELRAENLAALDCVDWVAISENPTATPLLETIRPDVYVKGREYEHNQDPRFEQEKEVVQRHGGRVVFTSGDVVFSSTALMAGMEHSADPVHRALRQLVDQHDLDMDRIEAIVQSFHGRRVLVVGETVIDTYVMCDRPEVAGEAAMMTLRPFEYRSFDGGAAIIARHLAALGARPTLLTALPRSIDSETMRLRLEVDGVDVRAIEVEQRLVEKQRFLVGQSKVMKLDLAEPLVVDEANQRRFVDLAEDIARGSEAVVVADFGLGLLPAPVLSDLCRRVRPHVEILSGDVSGRRSNLLAMEQMDLICPSEVEIRDALHDWEEGLTAVVWRLLGRTRSQAALVTLGDDGLIAFERRPDPPAANWSSRLHAEHVPALATHAVDQLGCGDALLAAATLTRLGGGSLALAGIVGSVAAAAEAQKLGNAVIGAAALRRGIRRLVGSRLAFDPEPAASSVLRCHDQLPVANSRST
ncbi:MAG: adenylyltransferase/cytidyltransferase family protein [Planctomycetes bacterium]|nr:adenylyltransferase/cytidyltransferase family protein [Planctomycetota bacterium]